MKRFISIFMVFTIVLALAGCSTVDTSSSLSSGSATSNSTIYFTSSVISERVSYPQPEEDFI